MLDPIPNDERLIFALDVPRIDDAKKMVKRLGDSIVFFKLGLELFMTDGYFQFIDWLREHGKKVFVDLKFFDVPATVGRAVRQLTNRGITFATIHGNDAVMRAAAEAKEDVKILAVTVLTSLDRGDLQDLGFRCDVDALVISRARRAVQYGCDGVVASGQESKRLREALGDRFLVVTPGIRPVDNDDDQKRVVTVPQAFANGADYIVVGRPIRDAADPRLVAETMQAQIKEIFDRGTMTR